MENQVLELTDQIKKLREAGNVLPEDLAKRAEDAEAKARELAGLLEVEKSKNSDSGAYLQLLKGSEQLQANYKQMYESALRELEAEKTKNAEFTARLQAFSGGKTMADNNQITQWEYKYVDADLSKLNEIGKEGWETTGNSNTNGILVKRPIKRETKEPDYGYSR